MSSRIYNAELLAAPYISTIIKLLGFMDHIDIIVTNELNKAVVFHSLSIYPFVYIDIFELGLCHDSAFSESLENLTSCNSQLLNRLCFQRHSVASCAIESSFFFCSTKLHRLRPSERVKLFKVHTLVWLVTGALEEFTLWLQTICIHVLLLYNLCRKGCPCHDVWDRGCSWGCKVAGPCILLWDDRSNSRQYNKSKYLNNV